MLLCGFLIGTVVVTDFPLGLGFCIMTKSDRTLLSPAIPTGH